MPSMNERRRACVIGAMKSLGCASTQSSRVPHSLPAQRSRLCCDAPHMRIATEQRLGLETRADPVVALDELGEDLAGTSKAPKDDQEHGHERLVWRISAVIANVAPFAVTLAKRNLSMISSRPK